jgi:hypothetical protein
MDVRTLRCQFDSLVNQSRVSEVYKARHVVIAQIRDATVTLEVMGKANGIVNDELQSKCAVIRLFSTDPTNLKWPRSV